MQKLATFGSADVNNCPHQCQFVMDNASFSKSYRIREIIEIIENIGCQLFYLPPYSSDLNPIEHDWAWLEWKLSYLWRHAANFYDRLSLALNLNCEITSVLYII
jgi:transposase